MDFSQRESRGLFSPPNGSEPQIIPDYWRETPNSPTVTNLPYLTDEELNSLGWKGPFFNNFSYNINTHKVVWDKESREYRMVELDITQKVKLINYLKFWNSLLDSFAYLRLKDLSKTSLEVNTTLTEFAVLLSDAKNGHPNVPKIQDSILDLLDVANFTEQELISINNIFVESGMNSIYVLNRDNLQVEIAPY